MAGCTNDKDIFSCILRFHACRGYFQHFQTLLLEIEGDFDTPSPPGVQYESGASGDSNEAECNIFSEHNFNVACETGFQYPAYETMSQPDAQVMRISVIYHAETVSMP